MENRDGVVRMEQDVSDNLPSLLRKVGTQDVADFDIVIKELEMGTRQHLSRFHPSNASPSLETTETTMESKQGNESKETRINHQRKQSVSMPVSPSNLSSKSDTRVIFNIESVNPMESQRNYAVDASKGVKFLSQPMPKGPLYDAGSSSAPLRHQQRHQQQQHHHHRHSDNNPAMRRLKDNRYNSFKTWSGKLERQITNLRGRTDPKIQDEEEEEEAEEDRSRHSLQRNDALPVHRYYDALTGPELETLRPSEEIMLPDDKTWPFLLRFPISSFGVSLGVSSQAIMWKALATTNSTKFLHITPWINTILWFISLSLVFIIACTYSLKIILFFEAVRREYYHPIRVNFFFAPWISLLFLALGTPPSITTTLPHWLWYLLMFPFLCLELKIYGQWMSGGQRRLSKVANPTNHLSVVGNFVGALLGASMGLKEGPIFFYAVGMAHYLVLFVTLYQRLPTNETLPKELHPVFFLFVAAPSVASMAWEKISGHFDYGSKMCYFLCIFLYFSLAVRINFFRGFKFSLAWWAYTFPMTGAAIATIKYSNAVTSRVTQVLAVVLSSVSTLTVTALLVSTIIHAFVLRNLFPNDIAIAISQRKPKPHKWFNNLRHGSSENIENYLKFTDSSNEDIEAAERDLCPENQKP